MRIAKYIANSGHCSRREAEKLIFNKKVFINQKLCETPASIISKNDTVIINGKIIKLETQKKLWKFYKPIKIICTNKDPQKRKTIFDILPKKIPRTILIGRLDYMSEGLILLTNNGDLARKLELPKSNIIRVYRVYIAGVVKTNHIDIINKGININGINYNKIRAYIEKKDQNNSWIKFKLQEGKNREIRNICKYFKWSIIKLIRLQFGPIKIAKEKPGDIKEIYPIPEEFND